MDNKNDDENGIVFLNVFMCYYKKLYKIEDKIDMFYDIDYNDVKSTNPMMENLYSHVYKYKKYSIDPKETDIYEPSEIDISTCPELYALTIDGKYNKVCRFLVPLIYYVSENYNWMEINWKIINLK